MFYKCPFWFREIWNLHVIKLIWSWTWANIMSWKWQKKSKKDGEELLRNRSIELNPPPCPNQIKHFRMAEWWAGRGQVWKLLLYQDLRRMKEIEALQLGELRKVKRKRKIISFADGSCGQHSLATEQYPWDHQVVSSAWVAFWCEGYPPMSWASQGSALRLATTMSCLSKTSK